MRNKFPEVFISYSHDDTTHIEWVKKLAHRLKNDGVDVKSDFFNLRLGQDLPKFMESGLTGANRVIAICSENYVKKADQGLGGVGYEKMVLSAHLMNNIDSNKIIPVIRNNAIDKELCPRFLKSKFFIDFREDKDFDKNYCKLLDDILETPKFPTSETMNGAKVRQISESNENFNHTKPKSNQNRITTQPRVEYKTFTDIEPDLSNYPFSAQFQEARRRMSGRAIQTPRISYPSYGLKVNNHDQTESDMLLDEIWEKAEGMHGIHLAGCKQDSFGNIMRREEYGCQSENGWVIAQTVEIDENGKEQIKNLEAMSTKKFIELSDSHLNHEFS